MMFIARFWIDSSNLDWFLISLVCHTGQAYSTMGLVLYVNISQKSSADTPDLCNSISKYSF